MIRILNLSLTDETMKLNLIAGRWVPGEEQAANFNPADVSDVIGHFARASESQVDTAVQAAREALPGWAGASPQERADLLEATAQRLLARKDDIGRLLAREEGKTLFEAVAETARAAQIFRFFAGEAIRAGGDAIASVRPDVDVEVVREPVGVVGLITPWNFPIAIPAWKIAPALAYGNTVVFKPADLTPACAHVLAEILHEAGAPAGIYNVIQGMGEVGGALVTDPRVDKVSLTGSVPTGKKVYAAAAEGMKHVTMELGGKSPLIIFDDADIDNAVGGAINGNFYSSGQVCSNGTRVFVQKGIKEKFLARLAERTGNAILGDPQDEATSFGPMVSENQMNIVLGYIEKGKEEGARLICGGKRADMDGYFIEPTVFADVTDDMTIAREEIFGPVMSVLDFDTEEEVIARANDTEFGLSAGVFTNDFSRAHRVIGQLEAGSCFINSYNDAPVEAPFGGVKASGVGRENSKEAIKHFSQVKSVYVRMGDVEAAF